MIHSLEKQLKNEENFCRSGAKARQDVRSEQKIRSYICLEFGIGSLRNNGAEVFRALNVQIFDQFSTTQSQRLLL